MCRFAINVPGNMRGPVRKNARKARRRGLLTNPGTTRRSLTVIIPIEESGGKKIIGRDELRRTRERRTLRMPNVE